MKKTILIFGIIAGLVVSGMLLINSNLENVDFDNGAVYGYITMLIAFSTIYFAIRSIRDKQLAGAIKFAKAMQIGLLITLIASTLYVISWMIIVYTSDNDFMQQYYTHSVQKMEEAGLPAAEIEKKKVEMLEFQEMYKNPFVKIGMTYLEIFPVGLLVSLICAFILKRKP